MRTEHPDPKRVWRPLGTVRQRCVLPPATFRLSWLGPMPRAKAVDPGSAQRTRWRRWNVSALRPQRQGREDRLFTVRRDVGVL